MFVKSTALRKADDRYASYHVEKNEINDEMPIKFL